MATVPPDMQLLNIAESLQPPWVLLEDGAARSTRLLAWDAAFRHRVEWTSDTVGVLEGLDQLPGGHPWFGAIGYDAGLPPRAARRTPLLRQPMIDLFAARQRIILKSGAEPELVGEDAVRRWNSRQLAADSWQQTTNVAGSGAGRSFDQPTFESAVRQALEYIRSGDIYQANLSVAERVPVLEAPFAIYRRLRAINPSPWMGYADFGDWQLVSCSPELLVDVRQGQARARPIAGTRKKTGDAATDDTMRRELRTDAKESAEHVMLVDLARNDLGRVARHGTVQVAELGRIEEYSHVMHLESDVTAELKPGVGALDVFRAMFPGGTITGCPKIRAMEIIAELEPVARGMYTGALGWWEGGAGQWNILIRSAVVRGSEAVIQAGAGIVADSDPAREWKEALRKAAALREAFGVAG